MIADSKPLSEIKVMVVEDDPSALKLLKQALQTEFRTVIEANGGSEAMQKYFTFFPEIIFTDIDMPVLDGLVFAKKVKEHNPNCRIIFATAMDSREILLKALKIGTSQFIFKPFDSEELLNAAEEARNALEIIQQRDRAIRETEAKNLFVAKLSHELRTPLNGILGFTRILLDTELDPLQKKFLRMVKDSSNSLLKIISDILDYTKIESGRMKLEKKDFRLRIVTGNAINIVSELAKAKGLDLEWNVDLKIPDKLSGDAIRLQEVLINILGNAVKFTDSGSVRLDVQPISIKDESAQVRFSISDTGPGIPDNKIDTLFEAFKQLDGSFKSKNVGIGLGLAISKEIVEMMNGSIEVESEVGKGSTFSINVEFEFAGSNMSDEVEDFDEPELKKAADKHPELKLNILLAEDSFINQEVIKIALGQKKWRCTIAQDGRETLELLEKSEFDLILMDIQMPEMDGLEATRIIRAKEQGTGAHIPIIGLTAHASELHKKDCFDSGMDDFIAKPFEWEDVFETIIRNVSKKESEIGKTPKADLGRLRESVVDPVKVRELTNLFITNTKKQIVDIVEYLKKGELKRLEQLAHKMQSEISNFGAEDVVSLAEQIEIAAEAGQTDVLSALIPDFEKEIAQLLEHLEKL